MPILNRKRQVVIFDLDGVICDFMASFSEIAARYYRITPKNNSDVTDWNILSLGLSEAELKELWERVDKMPNFWRDIPSLLNQYEWRSLWDLQEKGVEFVYLTNRWAGNNMEAQTTDWLWNNNVPRGAVIPVRNKVAWIKAMQDEINILGVIDDSPRNIDEYEQNGIEVFIRDWQYNKEYGTGPRGTVVDFCEYIAKKLEAENGR